jgi:UDP-N-acetylglucosamine transferase subunit ALG13
MIFVTVGTHEQSFDRLVRKIDDLIKARNITGDVFIQTGYSKYIPRFCPSKKFISYQKFIYYIRKADPVITHGGPGSIMPVLDSGKIPIVVPRQKKYNEHVDDHQIHFVKKLNSLERIISVYDIETLCQAIKTYHNIYREKQNPTIWRANRTGRIKAFVTQFEKLVSRI